jgi:hypothetical protein
VAKPKPPPISITAPAPTGSGSGVLPVNLGGLFPAPSDKATGLTTADQAEQAFAQLAVTLPQQLAQIQYQLYLAGFYSNNYVPQIGLLHPEDLAAFSSAVKTLSAIRDENNAPSTNLRDYLNNLARVGQQLGTTAASTRRRPVNVVEHPNPAAVRAAVDNAYVNVLGRKASDAEKAAFLRTFDSEVVRAQTLPDEAQQTTMTAGLDTLAAPASAGGPTTPGPGTVRLYDEAGDAYRRAHEAALSGQPDIAQAQRIASGLPDPLGGVLTDNLPKLPVGPGTVRLYDEAGDLWNRAHQAVSGTSSPDGQNTLIDTFLQAISRGESGGDAHAQNPHASASGLFGYTDGTWNHYGGYLHARDAPAAVQWAKARQDVANKLLAYKGNWRDVAMSWYFPPAVGNPALANTVPARQAGNTLTPNQYADLVMHRMLSGGAKLGPASASFDSIPSGTDALTPLRVDVTTPDLSAEAVESARAKNPVEAGAHDVAGAFDSFLRLLSTGG